MCRYFCDLNLFKMKGGKHFTRWQKRNVLERILQNSCFLRQNSTIITRSILKSRNSELIYRHWHLIFFSPCLVTVSVVVVQDYETQNRNDESSKHIYKEIEVWYTVISSSKFLIINTSI